MTLSLDIAPMTLDVVEADWLPSMQPYHYQWAAYQLVREAFETNQTLCLFLITPTGSGKTLASYAYSILHDEPVLGVYPTNELILDQERALEPMYRKVLQWDQAVLRLDSVALDAWASDMGTARHGEALERILPWRHILLTNPDILFYVAFGLYPNIAGQRERLLVSLGKNYRLTVFDEFHLYNAKQMADVAFFAGALQALQPGQGRVYIFASATPQVEIIPHLRDALGLRVEVLEAEPSEKPDARMIAHPLRLSLLPADLEQWKGADTLIGNLSLLDEFLQRYPAGRIVTIMEAVAAAIGTAEQFRQRYPAKAIGEVHGLSSVEERRQALRQEVTVGTTTIEVGIDFKEDTEKDILIFEAHTASKFLQRFGRLARHRKSKFTDIPNWVMAMVPPPVYNRVAERIAPESSISRSELYRIIEEAYQEPESFPNYLHKHAPAEFYQARELVSRTLMADVKEDVLSQVDDVIQALTGHSQADACRRYYAYERAGILAPLMSFRGTSFQAAILDERGSDPGFPAKQYNLLFLLRRGILEEVPEEVYQERVRQLELQWPDEAARALRHAQPIDRNSEDLLGVYGFFRLEGIRDDTRRVWFEVARSEVRGRKGEVTVISGLQLNTDPPLALRGANRLLYRKRIVAWIMDEHPLAIRRQRVLPHLFALYELRVQRPGGASGAAWTIAFNQDAFFLDSLDWRRKQRQSEAIIL